MRCVELTTQEEMRYFYLADVKYMLHCLEKGRVQACAHDNLDGSLFAKPRIQSTACVAGAYFPQLGSGVPE